MKIPHKHQSYQQLITQHLSILKKLQYDTGLFAASDKHVHTGYDKSWLRDNFYECLAFEVIEDWDTIEKTYNALLAIFLKHEDKIDYAIAHKPKHRHQYIHARFHPQNFDEFWEEWGNKQNDAIGAILFKIGKLERKGHRVIRTKDHLRIVNKLIHYLSSIQYWHDEDSGMWEENEEVHASSVGACVAGLKAISHIKGVIVNENLIKRGEAVLSRLLPRESEKKFVDLALLSLIWPYDVADAAQRREILKNVEYHLVRRKGVIRYKNDYYYNKNPDGYSEEAEWTFGLAWLTIIYEKLGEHEAAKAYLKQLLRTETRKGVPELYYSNTDEPNENNPLGWSESMFIIAVHDVSHRHMHQQHQAKKA
ncbi:glycoside hydrolase family 15 [Candidatus Woesearchaeota archaeon]|nr:glycoside hydrolase family 15 [Candidatus Woesearchaeota archaeon]